VGGGGLSITWLQGSQALPARPSDKGIVKVMTYGGMRQWVETETETETVVLSSYVIWWFLQQGGSFDQFKSGGLCEKYAVATWSHLSILPEDRGKPNKPVSRGRSQDLEYRIPLTCVLLHY
jgi:hypothetical protein